MQRSIFAIVGGAALIAGASIYGETHAQSTAPAAASTPSTTRTTTAAALEPARQGIVIGTLSCKVAGGMGFVFGSSKDLDCILTHDNTGLAERYRGTIKKFGLDIGFTKEAQMLWLVAAAGEISTGALAGDYIGAAAGASLGVGIGGKYLVRGDLKTISLQPYSVENNTGLNLAAGVAQVSLQHVK